MELTEFTHLKNIGQGATSDVSLIESKLNQEKFAFKKFRLLDLKDENHFKRLEQEIRILKSLRHNNIVSIYREIKTDEEMGIILEYVDGTSLTKWKNDYKLNLLEPKLWVLAQIARGLGAAHEKGIIHRDLKPENILISKTGEVKITDFGLAKSQIDITMTHQGLLVGSLGYLAPEIFNGDRPVFATDIFSFGVLAFELLTDQFPFSNRTPQELIKEISLGKSKSLKEIAPRVPLSISKMIDSCLSKDISFRPKNIWFIEAQLMTALMDSGLLSYCQTLVSEKRNENLIEVYEVKHTRLKKQLTELNGSDKLSVTLEFHELFPNSKDLPDIIEFKKNTKKWIILFLLFLLISSIGFYFTIDAKKSNQVTEILTKPVITSIPTEQPITEIKPEPIQMIKPEPSQILKPKVLQKFGFINFNLDEDVVVKIDGKLIDSKKLSNVKLKVGNHNVELIKDGFMPILNKIIIKENKTIKVNAKRDKL